MNEYEAIVLATARNTSLQSEFSAPFTAMVQIHHKPMLDWVIDAIRKSSYIKRITVIGPGILDTLLSARYTDRRLLPSFATIETLTKQSQVIAEDNRGGGYIILPCDAVYCTPQLLDETCALFEKYNKDVGTPVVRIHHISKSKVHSISTFTIDNRKFAVGAITLSRHIGTIAAAFEQFRQLHRDADPLHDSGFALPSVLAVGKHLDVRAEKQPATFQMKTQSITLRVTTPQELRNAHRQLAKPWQQFKKAKVIVNPFARKGSSKTGFVSKMIKKLNRKSQQHHIESSHSEQIERFLREFGLTPEVVKSANAEDATAIARDAAAKGYDLVIAAGGDGTINAVVNGLAQSGTPLGVIPLGTVNTYAIQFSIPQTIRSACQLIAEGTTRTIDLGKAGERYFTILSGVGFNAYVIQQTTSKLKRFLGMAAFITVGAFNLITYRFRTIHCTIDNQTTIRKGYLVVAGNGKYYSAHMIISPYVDMNDGLLDVVIFRHKNPASIVRYLWGLRYGTLVELKDIEFYQAKKVTIAHHGRHYIHVDGEYYGRTPVTINSVPSALKIIS